MKPSVATANRLVGIAGLGNRLPVRWVREARLRSLRRPKLALEPTDKFVSLERIKPLALPALWRARPLAAGSQCEPHQRIALRTSDGFVRPFHGGNFKI
jgi:hypothetical protein